MNNKGQVFALFMLVLPLMIMVFALVVDLGLLMTTTYKTKEVVKEAIAIGLKENNIEATELMLNANSINYELSNNGNIKVTVDGSYKAILGTIFNKNIYKYKFSYIGYIDNNEIHIEEE